MGRGMRAASASFLVAMLLLSAAAAKAWGPFNHLEPEFCDSVTVRGNPLELERLPPLRRPPASGQLPFLPDTLRFRANDEIQVGEGPLGFSLRQSDGHRSEDLGLSAKTTLLRIDRHGRVLQTLAEAQTQVASVKGYETISFSFDPAKPGLYRADIAFQDSSATRLGRYGTYFRILPLVFQPPRLALNARTFQAGELLLARVENFSRSPISYGVPYSIDRLQGGAWDKAPESPDGPWIMPLYGAKSGGTGPCLPFQIPDEMEPGRYRVVKPIATSRGGRRLFAEFTVGG